MSSKESQLTFNDRECEYDIYGDTRNNNKHNEEKPYAKYSYNAKTFKKINNSIMKKEKQSKKDKATNMKPEMEKKEKEENEMSKIDKKENKRKLKVMKEENKNYLNNYEDVKKKTKKAKKPKKDKIRFQKSKIQNASEYINSKYK